MYNALTSSPSLQPIKLPPKNPSIIALISDITICSPDRLHLAIETATRLGFTEIVKDIKELITQMNTSNAGLIKSTIKTKLLNLDKKRTI